MVKKISNIIICSLLVLFSTVILLKEIRVVTALDNGDSQTITYDEGYQAVSGYETPSGITSIATKNDYPWGIYSGQVLKSTNKGVSSSVSLLQIKVTGIGVLNFDYRVYAPDKTNDGVNSSTVSESNPDSFIISIGKEVTTSTPSSTVGFERHYGNTGWLSKSISIEPESDTIVTTVYLAFKKNGSTDDPNDLVLIKNISFNKEFVTVNAVSSNDTYGTVTGGSTLLSSKTVTLVATPKNGGKFYGWQEDGKVLDETNSTFTFVAGKDRTITAIFGNESNVICKNVQTGFVYESLASAFSSASSGNEILLEKDTIITENLTIPEGITLQIPYSSVYDKDGNDDGSTSDLSSSFATESLTYRRLTINNGVTLTVKGNLLIGGIISYPSQLYQGHTSGVHGRVTNNGTIIVDGGRIDSYGFIDGSGSLNASSGFVYEPFVVFDFSGGNNTAELFFADQNSFTEYTMQNITCSLTISSNACLGAYLNLYAGSQFNKAQSVIIGDVTKYPKALIGLSSGSSITRTVDKTKFIKGGAAGDKNSSYGADIYKTKYEITGGAKLGNLEIVVQGITVSVPNFPVPYCYDYVLKNGDYEIPTGWNIMPGASLVVDIDATLTNKGILNVFDGLVNTGMSGRYYPSSTFLKDNGFSTCGLLDVKGKLILKSESTFGGIIQSSSLGAIVEVEEDVIVNRPSVQFGAMACYDDNTCILPLHGKLKFGNDLIIITPGKTYETESISSWVFESYTVTKYSSYNTSNPPEGSEHYLIPSTKGTSNPSYAVYEGPLVVTVNQTMVGSFAFEGTIPGSFTGDATVINKTYYNDSDSTRTELIEYKNENGIISFKVNRKTAGKSYNYVVQYAIGSNDLITITPNSDGVYTISNVQDTLTIIITSVLKGDVNLDGEVAGNDVTKLRRFLAGYTTTLGGIFNEVAADCNGDNEIAGNDVTRLRRYLAGYIDEL